MTSARTQEVISGETVSSLPTSRQYGGLIALVPAINVQGNDVGGAQGGIFNVFQVHGGRRNEGQVQVDGMSAGYQGMGVSSYVTEIGNAQEVVFSSGWRAWRGEHRRPADEHHRQAGREQVCRELLHQRARADRSRAPT